MKRSTLILLALLGLASAAIYGGAFAAPLNLFALAAEGAKADLGALTGYSKAGAARYVGGLCILFGLYGLAIWQGRTLGGRRACALVMGVGVASALIACLVYPYGADDIFLYVVRGRVLGIFGWNSLMVPPRAFPTDTYLPFLSEWTAAVSPYGPLWEYIAALAARVGDGSRVRSLLAFKGIGLLSYLACCWLVFQILSYRKSPTALAGLIAFAWNPLVILETHAMGHNDLLMMVAVLAAISLWDRGHYSWVLVALTLGGLIKYMPLLLLPPTLLLIKRRLSWRAWISACLQGGAISGVLALASFARLWPGLRYLSVLQQAGRMHTSPCAALALVLMSWLDESTAYIIAMWALRAAFVAAYSATLVRIWMGRLNLVQAYHAMLYAWLVFGATAFGYWYVLWIMALAPLLPIRGKINAIIFSWTGALSVAIYTFVWAWTRWSFLKIYSFSIPFVFITPLLVAALWPRRTQSVAEA